MESPKLEFGHGICKNLSSRQHSAMIHQASERVSCSTVQRRGPLAVPLTSGTTPSAPASAWPSGGTWRGTGNPSHPSTALQLEMGCQPRSHPAPRRQSRRTGHTAPSHEQLHTSGDKQPAHRKLRGTLWALPSFQQPRRIRVLVPFPGLFCSFQLTLLIVGSAGQGKRTASLPACT